MFKVGQTLRFKQDASVFKKDEKCRVLKINNDEITIEVAKTVFGKDTGEATLSLRGYMDILEVA